MDRTENTGTGVRITWFNDQDSGWMARDTISLMIHEASYKDGWRDGFDQAVREIEKAIREEANGV